MLDALPGHAEPACPNCGHRTLRLVLQDTYDPDVVRAYFWCSTCLFGIAFGRVPAPEGVDVLPRVLTDEQFQRYVPDYRLVPPRPRAGGDSEVA
jgi:hypothetical protein